MCCKCGRSVGVYCKWSGGGGGRNVAPSRAGCEQDEQSRPVRHPALYISFLFLLPFCVNAMRSRGLLLAAPV